MSDASDVQSDFFLFDIPSQEKNIKFPQFCFMPSVTVSFCVLKAFLIKFKFFFIFLLTSN
jgi:hypothetical protein